MITGFSLDIYDSDISFAWNTNEKELSAFLDKVDASAENREEFFHKINEDCAGAITVSCGSGTSCITIFKEKPNNTVVAHEIYHIAYRILQPRGIEDEEAWAYLIGYLTEMFYDLYLGNEEVEDITPEEE